MGKKTKSKARLDKYYHLSKEMGYRSRAAFKLIQLNKKFNFLSGATVLIDLCAAPGGWCQVAAKEMPISSIKIGIDLDPIKPIPGVTTFQCDITTEQCRHLIRKEIKHLKADVVLHDGAPNVGGQWAKDSYNQNELVLYSIKLATEFLKEGGWFISKVFRSVDYNALLYVMKQLFQKVEATKPLASRSQAAEIFVICQGYKNPSYIDPKLLDPKYALKQIDDEDTLKNNTINSLKAMFAKKKNRAGYNTDTLFVVKSFKDYIECSNPFKFLFETNKIKIETEDCKKYLNVVNKTPKDYQLYFDDLQVLGKKEMEELIIWRNKIRTKLNLTRKENSMTEKEEKKEEDKKEKDINEEMDEEIKKYEKQRKKRLEAQKKKQEKIELSNKKAFILQEDQPHDNDVENDDELYEYMQKNDIDIENLEEPKAEEEEEEEEENDSKEINYSDLTEDDYIDMMNEDIEENKRLYEEEKEIKKRNKENKEKKKKKGEIELVKNDQKDNDEILDNIDIDEEEENEGDDSALYDEDEEDGDEEEKEDDKELPLDEEEEDIKDDIIINNPLRKEKKIKQENKEENKNKSKNKKAEDSEDEEDNLSYDTDEQLEKEQEQEKEDIKDGNNLLNKKTQRPKDASSSEDESDGYNSDEKAEIRAIAKKMLRKKERLKILNSSYNRYAFEDDGKVPKWFLEDESKHNKPQKPITKAEVLAEKEYLKKITVRMPKKVLEAKARKRNKLNKRLQKIRKQAEGIANQDEYTEISKVKQIEKLYKREINKSKEKKRYIISRSWSNNKGKDSRNVRHVDRRIKKDKRAAKAREKRNKKYKRRR